MVAKIAVFGFLVGGITVGAGASAQESASKWQFEKAGMRISVVAKESEYDDRRSYQVVVEDEIRTLSRLEVNRDATITNVWQTDLDADGAFEIVVTTAQVSGSTAASVDVHEWNGSRFESTRLRRNSAADVGYQGYDQFELKNGTLTRSYPIFTTQNGNSAPSGDTARYVLRSSDLSWVKQP